MTAATPAAPSLDAALRAPELDALSRDWSSLRMRGAGARDPGFVKAVTELAKKFIAHRDMLFLASATLQADAPDADAPEVAMQFESNQLAVKRCTVVLGEMNEALGRTWLHNRPSLG